MSSARQFWVMVHRWTGLMIALFLIVAGATGTLLPFNEELTDLTAPWHRVAPPAPDARMIDAVTLNEVAGRAAPAGYRLEGLRLATRPGHVLDVYLAPIAEGRPYLTASINPYTAKVVRIGEEGRLRDGWDQIMPFLYSLHYSLALGAWGTWFFGVAALIWTLDCFVGFWLTLPPIRFRWRQWRKSWRVRWGASGYKINFDLHRAGGLWLWPMLLVFAWSSVGMNLRPVYDPIMQAFGSRDPGAGVPDRPLPQGYRPDWRQAEATARGIAAASGIVIRQESSLYFDRSKGTFTLGFRSAHEFTDDGGWSSIMFYPSGQVARFVMADGGLGQGGVDTWLTALHVAAVGGLAYRMLVSALGLIVVMLSVTGIVIWMRKRSARLLGKAKAARKTRADLAVVGWKASLTPGGRLLDPADDRKPSVTTERL